MTSLNASPALPACFGSRALQWWPEGTGSISVDSRCCRALLRECTQVGSATYRKKPLGLAFIDDPQGLRACREARCQMRALTDKLVKLCHGVQAVGPGIEIQIKPSETEPGKWSIVVIAGAVIIFATDFERLEIALDAACAKIASMSTRMMAAVSKSTPPPDTEKD